MLEFNRLGGTPRYDLADHADQALDLFALAASEDCEDIVAIYLQARFGYRLIRSTCRHDTPKTEFVLARADGKAQIQVKQGSPLDRTEYAFDPDDPCQWFLFTTGDYRGPSRDHVHCLDPQERREFAFDNLAVMPGRVRRLAESLPRSPRLALSPPADRPAEHCAARPSASVPLHSISNRTGSGAGGYQAACRRPPAVAPVAFYPAARVSGAARQELHARRESPHSSNEQLFQRRLRLRPTRRVP